MTPTSDGLQIDEALGAIVFDKAGVLIPESEELTYRISFEGRNSMAFVLYSLGQDKNGNPMWYNVSESDSTGPDYDVVGLEYEIGGGTYGRRVILVGWYKEAASADDPWKQAKIEVDDQCAGMDPVEMEVNPCLFYRFSWDNGSGEAAYAWSG